MCISFVQAGLALVGATPARATAFGRAGGIGGLGAGMRPADTSAEPVIGTTALPGETLTLRRFSSFVPMPTTTGDLDEMALPAGQGVGLIRAIEPAETIVRSMMAEAEEIALRLGRPQLPPT